MVSWAVLLSAVPRSSLTHHPFVSWARPFVCGVVSLLPFLHPPFSSSSSSYSKFNSSSSSSASSFFLFLFLLQLQLLQLFFLLLPLPIPTPPPPPLSFSSLLPPLFPPPLSPCSSSSLLLLLPFLHPSLPFPFLLPSHLVIVAFHLFHLVFFFLSFSLKPCSPLWSVVASVFVCVCIRILSLFINVCMCLCVRVSPLLSLPVNRAPLHC